MDGSVAPDSRIDLYEADEHTWLLRQVELLRVVLAGARSMAQHLPEMIDTAYAQARRLASGETQLLLSRFPTENPWTLDEALHWTPPEQAE